MTEIPINDAAAIRIFRDVFEEYVATCEIGSENIRPSQVEFKADFENHAFAGLDDSELRLFAQTLHPETAFSKAVQQKIYGASRRQIVAHLKARVGRNCARVGLWPVEDYFRR